MASRSRWFRASWVVLGLAAGLLAPAVGLGATTVSYSPTSGLLVQGDGVGEDVFVTVRSDRFEITRGGGGAPLTLIAGSGCQVAGATGPFRCPFAGTNNRVVTANLGGGADAFFLLLFAGVPPVDAFIDGGGGNDQLSGRDGADFIDGGPGDDELDGGEGNDVVEGGDGNDLYKGDSGGTDTFRGEGGNDVIRALGVQDIHPDLFDGGPGVDVADYSQRASRVILKTSLQSTTAPDDGAPGEGDDLDNVETLIGGSGADTLEIANIVLGPGLRVVPTSVYTLRGNGGTDSLRAAGLVRTSMDGGAGSDAVAGGGSSDVIFSREGERDVITCGAGIDTVKPDLRDQPLPVDCENLDQSDRREGPNVAVLTRIARVDGDGRLSVRLACPRSVRVGCRGSLVARLDRRGARFGAKGRYSLNRGSSTVVEVALPSGQVAGARRPGARVRVRSVEAGVHGPKTTQRSLVSRPR